MTSRLKTALGALAIVWALMLAGAPAVAWAQPRPTPKPAPADLVEPSWGALHVVHLQVREILCSYDDKKKAIAEAEQAVKFATNNRATIAAWLPKQIAYADALAAAGRAREAKNARDYAAREDGDTTRALANAQKMLKEAMAREIVDCRDLKKTLPQAPKLLPQEWGKREHVCDETAKAAYLGELGKAFSAAYLNRERTDDHYRHLKDIEYSIEEGWEINKRKAEIKAIADGYKKTVDEIEKEFDELRTEIERVEKNEPIDCNPPKTTPAPTPKPTPAPAPQPAPGPANPQPTPDWAPHRPVLLPIGAVEVPVFCDEFQRNAFLTDVLLPALAKANQNAKTANGYLSALNADFAKANGESAPTAVLVAIQQEIALYGAIAKQQQVKAAELQGVYQLAMSKPLFACAPPRETARPGTPPTDGPKTPTDGPKFGCNCLDRTPIEVGPNNRVGSGARTRQKALSTAAGLVGGLLGGGGGGGGGGGASDGPRMVACRINDKEMTVVDDPATGISLKVGAKRAGDRVTVFADVVKSPDSGTFQTAYLQDGDGARQAPRDVGICGLWGEWQLTVSWTKTTYVDNQVVSREEGGWSKSGAFHIPGLVSSTAAPDGLWKRLGFSNASHGAREVALQYDLPAARLADGVSVMIHVTRPGQNPVTTAPFPLVMHEGPKGFTFERAPVCRCEAAAAVSRP